MIPLTLVDWFLCGRAVVRGVGHVMVWASSLNVGDAGEDI